MFVCMYVYIYTYIYIYLCTYIYMGLYGILVKHATGLYVVDEEL